MDGDDSGLGDLIRRARTDKNLSLRRVAELIGVSPSLLSQIENGHTQPSVKTLFGVAALLELSLDSLATGRDDRVSQDVADRERSAGIQRASDRPHVEFENGVRWDRLASGRTGQLETLAVTYPPHASSSADGRMMRHGGTEFAVLLEGELHLKLDFDVHVLSAGDSFCFESSRPHLFENRADLPARGLWVMFGGEAGAPADAHRDAAVEASSGSTP